MSLVRLIATFSALVILGAASPQATAMCSAVKCREAGKEAGKSLEKGLEETAATTADKTHESGVAGFLVTGKCAADFAAAAKFCKEEKDKECVGRCGTPECKRKFDDIAAGFANQAGSCGSDAGKFKGVADTTAGGDPSAPSDPGGGDTPPAAGGGSDSLMPMLAGAALGGLAGYMLGKKDDDKKEEEPKPPGEPGEEETPREPVDCSPVGSESKSECNAQFEEKCSADPAATGCSTFMTSYCAKGATKTKDPVDTGSDQIAPTSNEGEGRGTAFCNVIAFCAGGTHDNCLTCIEAKRPKPSTCAADPSTCIAQYSQTEIDAAKVACPVDPKFSDPKFAAAEDLGVPAVILPKSIDRGPASDIEGRYGKSVFSIGSNTFKKMCDEGRLNNCPIQ